MRCLALCVIYKQVSESHTKVMLQTCTREVPRLNLSYTGSLWGVFFSHSRPMSSRTYIILHLHCYMSH